MNAETKVKAAKQPETLRIWNAVCKTDPRHTKRVNQRGGFTAIDAQYQIMEATRQFGPVGEGWGYDVGEFQIVGALIVVPVTIWHTARENTFGPILGCAEMMGQRPDRDAPKKAITDAITKGLSQLGFNADVFLGRFDDNKYVAEITKEFAANDEQGGGPAARTKLEGPLPSKTALKAAIHKIATAVINAESVEAVNEAVKTGKAAIDQADRDWPELLTGDPALEGDDEGLKRLVARRRQELTTSTAYQFLASLIEEATTGAELQNIASKHGEAIDQLDDLERRRFEKRFDEREAGLTLVDQATTGA